MTEEIKVSSKVVVTKEGLPNFERTGEVVAMAPDTQYEGVNFSGWDMWVKFGKEPYGVSFGAYHENEVTPVPTNELVVVEVLNSHLEKQMADAVEASQFDTFGQLRDSVRDGFDCPCFGCYDYHHPDASHWQKAVGAAYALDLDWRNLP